MRLLVISDIHGNRVALQRVIEDAGDSTQQIVCLGDVAWGGPQPSEVIRELRRLACPVVMGNTDEFLVGDSLERLNGHWKDMERWCRQVLSDDDRAFVRGFRPTITVDLGGDTSVLCYHGSPRSNREGVLPETPGTEIVLIFEGHREKILVGGHTHSQMIRRFNDRLIINPGSVGLPFEFKGNRRVKNPPWAEYAMLDYTEGKLSVALRRVGYDIKALEDAASKSDMPGRDRWIKDWRR